jgi:tRNA threonylcarbamoyladenosine biosynthesis protein TsaE
MKKFVFHSNGPAATTGFGEKIGGQIKEGSVIGLTGELGCGKTLLTRGICAGLGVPLRQVNSPTFIMINEYLGRMPVFHLDMYQMSTEAEVIELGITDYLYRARSGVMIIEWAEKIISLLPDDLLRMNFEVVSARKRRLELTARGDKFEGLFKELGGL